MRSRSPVSLLVVCIVLGAASVLSWLSPSTRQGALLERFSYVQFWLAVFLTLATLTAFTITSLAEPQRRTVAFRTGAVWLGLGLGLLAVELGAFLWPAGAPRDNPWCSIAGDGTSAANELPYGRPAHMKWKGLSRGDLAVMNGDPDPYARRITFQTDKDGFHNSTDIERADIITIGDSYTEAGNVPEAENFSTVLAQKLNRPTRNLGRAGYSPPSELAVLRNYGLGCRPKLVVWQITESNDLTDALWHEKWVRGGRQPVFGQDLDWVQRRLKEWRHHSPTFRLFDLFQRNHHSVWPYDGWFRVPEGREHLIRFWRCPKPSRSVREHKGWPVVAEALTTGTVLCRSNGIQLIVLFIPTKYRVLGPFTRMLDASIPSPPVHQEVGPDTLGGLLRSLCNSLDVPFVDATPGLKQRASEGELPYLPYDTHLSIVGHKVVADLLVEKLRETAAPN